MSCVFMYAFSPSDATLVPLCNVIPAFVTEGSKTLKETPEHDHFNTVNHQSCKHFVVAHQNWENNILLFYFFVLKFIHNIRYF